MAAAFVADSPHRQARRATASFWPAYRGSLRAPCLFASQRNIGPQSASRIRSGLRSDVAGSFSTVIFRAERRGRRAHEEQDRRGDAERLVTVRTRLIELRMTSCPATSDRNTEVRIRRRTPRGAPTIVGEAEFCAAGIGSNASASSSALRAPTRSALHGRMGLALGGCAPTADQKANGLAFRTRTW